MVITPAMLQNPNHPGSTYETLRFLGTSNQFVRIVMPAPATNFDACIFDFENRTNTTLQIANDPITGDIFALNSFKNTELSPEQFVLALINGSGADNYRTQGLIVVEGAYRVPGYSGF